MIRVLAGVAVVAAVTVFAEVPKVTLRGRAESCYSRAPVRVGVGRVKVSAFRVSSVPSLMGYLNAFDTTRRSRVLKPEAMMMRLDTLWRKADSVARLSTPLGRAVSDSLGVFEFMIPAADSVLVYASWNSEDETFPEAHMTMSGRTSRQFVLDIAHGGCGP